MVTTKSLRLGIDARPAATGAASFSASAAKVKGAAVGAAGATAQLTKAVGALAAYASVGAAIRVIAQYEERLTVLQAVTRSNDAAMRPLIARTKELGATTRHTAAQAAEGAIELARAGFDTNETISALGDTLNLATAAEIGLAEASGYVANTIRQFSLAASDAGRVADAFTVAANNSNTNVQQLAESMGYAGTIAGVLSISVEKTAAMMGALADRAIKASMAGTNMRGVLLALTDPTDKLRAGLDKLGLTYDQVNPATNDILDVFERFKDGIDALPNSLDAAGIANQIFGRRNAAAAIAIASSIDRVRELNQLQIESKAAHEDVARALEQTLIGKFNALKSATQALMLETGDAGLTGALKSLLDTSTDAMRILGGLEGAFDDAGLAARIAAAAVAALAARLAFAGIAGGITAIGRMTTALGGLAIGAGGLLGPLSLAAGAVALMALEMNDAAAKGAKFAASARDVRESIEKLSGDDYQKGLALGGDEAKAAMDARIKQLNEFVTAAREGREYLTKGKVEDMFPQAAGLRGRGQLGMDGGLGTFGQRASMTKQGHYITEEVIALAEQERAAIEAAKAALVDQTNVQQLANELKADQSGNIADYIEKLEAELKILSKVGATVKETALEQAKARALQQAEQSKGAALTTEEANEVERLVAHRAWLNEVLAEQVKREGAANTASEEAADRLKAHATGVAELKAQLERQIDVQDALRDGRTKDAAMLQFELQMQQRGIILGDAEAEMLKVVYARLLDTTDARKAEGKASEQTFDRIQSGLEQMEKEIAQRQLLVDSVGMTEDQYSRASEKAQIMAEATALSANASDEQRVKIDAARDSLLALVDATAEAAVSMELIQTGQNAFVDMFSDIITGSASAADAFEAFASRMMAAMTELILKRALMNALFGGFTGGGASTQSGTSLPYGGTVDARGAMFDGSGRHFAQGAVFGQTTPITYPGGHGVIAEAGSPEAVMPLKRDSKGNLGVRMTGGSGGQTVNNYNVTIKAADYESFRKSRKQISDDFRAMGARN